MEQAGKAVATSSAQSVQRNVMLTDGTVEVVLGAYSAKSEAECIGLAIKDKASLLGSLQCGDWKVVCGYAEQKVR